MNTNPAGAAPLGASVAEAATSVSGAATNSVPAIASMGAIQTAVAATLIAICVAMIAAGASKVDYRRLYMQATSLHGMLTSALAVICFGLASLCTPVSSHLVALRQRAMAHPFIFSGAGVAGLALFASTRLAAMYLIGQQQPQALGLSGTLQQLTSGAPAATPAAQPVMVKEEQKKDVPRLATTVPQENSKLLNNNAGLPPKIGAK